MTLLRQYEDVMPDGYPWAWHHSTAYGSYPAGHSLSNPPIKDMIRMQAGHRCERCHHPYPPGIAKLHPRGEWTPCDEYCMHGEPYRYRPAGEGGEWRHVVLAEHVVSDGLYEYGPDGQLVQRWEAEGQWRILTVHHLTGEKADCRWWNLAALCQRCHFTIQGRVVMGRPFVLEHSDWMKPHAAGFYAWKYLDEDLTREETMARLDELLALEHRFTQEALL